jgi:hypothetical protein
LACLPEILYHLFPLSPFTSTVYTVSNTYTGRRYAMAHYCTCKCTVQTIQFSDLDSMVCRGSGNAWYCEMVPTFPYQKLKEKASITKKDTWISYCKILGYVPYQCRHRIIRFKIGRSTVFFTGVCDEVGFKHLGTLRAEHLTLF